MVAEDISEEDSIILGLEEIKEETFFKMTTVNMTMDLRAILPQII